MVNDLVDDAVTRVAPGLAEERRSEMEAFRYNAQSDDLVYGDDGL